MTNFLKNFQELLNHVQHITDAGMSTPRGGQGKQKLGSFSHFIQKLHIHVLCTPR